VTCDCAACLGKTASVKCEREPVATREEVRRLWCHVQAMGPAAGGQMNAQAIVVYYALREELERMACR